VSINKQYATLLLLYSFHRPTPESEAKSVDMPEPYIRTNNFHFIFQQAGVCRCFDGVGGHARTVKECSA